MPLKVENLLIARRSATGAATLLLCWRKSPRQIDAWRRRHVLC
jgi:hypothetical protein